MEKIEDNDRTILYCKAIANPSKINYSWSKTSKEETNYTFDEISDQLVIDISGSNEKYFCNASNSVGLSQCSIDVPGKLVD